MAEPEAITSDAEEAAEFEDMSEKEIDDLLDKEEVEPQSQEEQPKQQDQQTQEVQDGPAQDEPPAEATVGEMQEKLDKMEKLVNNFSKEAGQSRKMIADFDALQKKLENQNPAQQPSQEEQAAEARLNSMFEKFVKEKYGNLIDRAQDQQDSTDFFDEIKETAGDDFKKLDPYIAKLYDEKSKAAYEGGDQAALAWMQKAEKSSAFVVLEATRLAEKEVNADAANAVSNRNGKARSASVTVRTSSQPLPKGELTQAQLDKMSEEEIDKYLDENKVI